MNQFANQTVLSTETGSAAPWAQLFIQGNHSHLAEAESLSLHPAPSAERRLSEFLRLLLCTRALSTSILTARLFQIWPALTTQSPFKPRSEIIPWIGTQAEPLQVPDTWVRELYKKNPTPLARSLTQKRQGWERGWQAELAREKKEGN